MSVLFNLLLVMTGAWIGIPVDARFSPGIARIGRKFLSRADPAKMVATGATVTSLYVGSTGIWFRSETIAAINELERGEKEKALESLQLAITTLAVFDITQATVQPIASVLINKMIAAKGFFPTTFARLTAYKRALPTAVLNGGNSADDVLDIMVPLKERIKNAFGDEVTSFLTRSQGYDDLVTSLNNAKGWAKALKWTDVLAGPIFDSAMVAFSAYQLHLAITDTDSAPEVRELSIASASLGIASGVVGIASFAVAALATAGSALAAFGGPVGAIIGLLLGFTAIIIDLINSVNPYNTIKEQLETLDKLKSDSLKYLDIPVDIAKSFAPDGLNTGFDTIYQANQAGLVDFRGALGDDYVPWYGVGRDPQISFSAKSSTRREGDYLAKGQNRVYDKSEYRNAFFKPSGRPHIGYEFYGKNAISITSQDRNPGLTVRVNTDLIADTFWQRGVEIDTRVEDGKEKKQSDNVVIGYMGNLAQSDRTIRVTTGAGDDLLQLTGLVCARDYSERNCLGAHLGSGINTFSLRGMNTDRLDFFRISNRNSKVVGFHYKMCTHVGEGYFYLRLDDSTKFQVGMVAGISVFYGSPLDDVVEMSQRSNAVIKEISGRNEYIVHIEANGDRYTHTIEDNSEHKPTIKLDLSRVSQRFSKDNLRFSKETNTIVIYNRRDGGSISQGKIILKRKDGNQAKHFKIKIPSTRMSSEWEGDVEELVANEVGTHDGWNAKVYGIPYKYFMAQSFTVYREVTEKCNFFMLELNPPGEEPSSGEIEKTLESFHDNSYIKISESLMEKLKENYVLIFKRRYRDNFFFFEKRETKASQDYIYRIKIYAPTSYPFKAVLFGDMGSQKLLYDIKNDVDSYQIDIYKEWQSLKERPERPYRFNRNYNARTTQGTSLVLGAPTTESTLPEWWFVRLGEPTDPSSRNALIVTDSIYASIDRDGEGQFKIIFRPGKLDYRWIIHVRKKNGNEWDLIHKVVVGHATELSYEQGITRHRLKSLRSSGGSSRFDLYDLMKDKLTGAETPLSVTDTYKCEG